MHSPPGTDPTGNLGDVRLVDGGPFAGRVEYCDGTAWGTVCDNNFGMQEATVICNQLGLGGKKARSDFLYNDNY